MEKCFLEILLYIYKNVEETVRNKIGEDYVYYKFNEKDLSNILDACDIARFTYDEKNKFIYGKLLFVYEIGSVKLDVVVSFSMNKQNFDYAVVVDIRNLFKLLKPNTYAEKKDELYLSGTFSSFPIQEKIAEMEVFVGKSLKSIIYDNGKLGYL